MSSKTKRVFKRLVSWAGILFFALAVGMLYWQLRKYSFTDIVQALLDIPFRNLVYASFACLAGYITLSVYDYLALRYVGQANKVSWWKWMLAGMLGFAISNNAGHAVLSGGTIRYRLYTRWRIRAADIVKMVTFSGFTYFLGAVAIVVGGYFMVPHSLFQDSIAGSVGLHILFLFCAASLGAYFAMTFLFKGKRIHISELDFKIPKPRTALYQMLVGIADSVFAALVLYFCIRSFVDVPFTTFIGIFVIAQTAGVFSQVPGGIGVFETVIMMALPGVKSQASVFGALLAFRVIYYVIPLIGMGGLFVLYEHTLRTRMQRWIDEAKALKARMNLPNLPKIQLPKLPVKIKKKIKKKKKFAPREA
ncbi:MAG: lysylphosphatidylglycerol synthase domain-containing protein [Alphaproteobacteria bacterium]|nr:lysylphosphatidylglycerol synthase domain-containing protein [Alphaproteobacteria bacterium]